MKAILLAGGGGTRLWPLSREDFPKQFLNFGSEFSLLQKSVQRLLQASFIEEIVVATNTHHLKLVEEQLKKIDASSRLKIIVEPYRRNTAPAIAFSLRYLEDHCGAKESDVVVVLPSDHLIEPESLFISALEQMGQIAAKKKIITFGIRPTKAETGYGYIQIGKKFDGITFQVERFIEKPDLLHAETYLANPHFYWNAGIFIFSIDTFWKQLEMYSPQLYFSFEGSYEEIKKKFDLIPDISIDYALLEKSPDILVHPLAVSWSDVGSWDSVYDALEKDNDGNVSIGQVFAVDTTDSLILGGSRLISTIGLENMLIVETEDALFISKKGESQRVKNLVKELVKKGRKESSLHKIQVQPWGYSHLIYENDNYTIQKIQMNRLEDFECQTTENLKLEWVLLKGEIDVSQTDNQWLFSNLGEGTVEILLIRKKTQSILTRVEA